MSAPRIVILGAGFGGVYVAKKFRRLAKRGLIELTIVNRTNYFLFTPLLHEVATGGLNPRSVSEPLREIFAGSGIRIMQGVVDSISAENRAVSIRGNSSGNSDVAGAGSGTMCVLSYDYLVISTGAETNHYGIPGAAEHTLPLKNLMDATTVRSRIIDAFERAMLIADEERRKKALSFAVVGGGATGVEVAAELSELIRGMVRRYFSVTNGCRPGDMRSCGPEEPALSLVHSGKELLEMFAPALRRSAEKRLTKNGVILKMGCTVSEVSADGLRLSDGSFVQAETVIWAAGVKAAVPRFEGRSPALAGGRIVVDQFFRMQGDDRIFALGDNAGYVDAHSFKEDSKNTKALPMLAQVAVKESKAVAFNIIAAIKNRPLRNFHYHSNGTMVSVGQWFAIGEIKSLNIAGWITWWLWRTVYLFKFASWQKRTRIAIEWTLDFFYPRDITKLM